MKLQVLNDLHIEFGEFNVPETDADIVVFAGDIGVGAGGLEWIESQYIEKPVIYVLGNHEFYNHEINIVDDIKASAPEYIHVLNDDITEIDGVRFLGSTLWTDFLLFGESERYFAIQNARKNMSDFEVIKNKGRKFTPEDSIKLHVQSRNWLKDMLSTPFNGKTVVITHHTPSFKSVHPRFANNILTPAFTSNLDEFMDGEQVALWLHGHTHDAFDYVLNGTRVVCNPRGYVGYEKSLYFNPNLVIEI